MRKTPAILAFLALSYVLIAAAPDWLNSGGDPQRSGWQKRDNYINKSSLKQFKLLWKLKLEGEAKGLNSLTSPTIFGPIITHRGMKELVLIASASDDVFAVDADLGRIFWKRHLESAAASDPKPGCAAGLTGAPVIAPLPPAAPGAKPNDDPTPWRPVYVVSSDGILHTVRTTTGTDRGAVRFLPPGANFANLSMPGNVVYTTTSNGCGGTPNGVWAIDPTAPEAQASFVAAGGAAGGVSAGFDGTVYSSTATDGAISLLTPDPLKQKGSLKLTGLNAMPGPPSPFLWKGRELLTGVTRDGRVFVADPHSADVTPSSITPPLGVSEGLATWEDPAGTRWIGVAVGGSETGQIIAFQLVDKSGQPELVRAWTSRSMVAPKAPAIVNGIVFVLASGEYTGTAQDRIAKSTPAILYALDATTGQELYSSGTAVTSFTHSSGLAVANGHVCFGTFDNTLYCFGIPTDI